ncbi:MAG: hypothetical protein KME14_25255 [Tildeniella torsiva UHER 1998/13D]|jgi:hypothetical protein|nr:hypothetical protein [Tildeniella torsiva UHER 1998/13D]
MPTPFTSYLAGYHHRMQKAQFSSAKKGRTAGGQHGGDRVRSPPLHGMVVQELALLNGSMIAPNFERVRKTYGIRFIP